ncbi:MAG: DUF2391 family protein [Planctomycetota bacterium]
MSDATPKTDNTAEHKSPGFTDVSESPILKQLNGYLHSMTPVFDETGELLSWAMQPVMVEFKARDIAQVVVGSTILAVPMILSDETIRAAEEMTRLRIGVVAFVSVGFIAAFAYFNFYRKMIRGHVLDFTKRVVLTYGISLAVVLGLMETLGQTHWSTEYEQTLRHMILVGLPASMFATVADAVK